MKSINIILLSVFSLTMSGCVVLALGAGALGGMAISKDEIEGHTDAAYGKVWKALEEVIEYQGTVTIADEKHGHLEALVEESEVEANLEQVTPQSVRVRIKARKTKGLLPNIELAQKIYTEVMKEVH